MPLFWNSEFSLIRRGSKPNGFAEILATSSGELQQRIIHRGLVWMDVAHHTT